MALAIVNSASYTNGDTAATSHNVTLPSSIVSGNLLLLFCGINGTPTVTDPTGWTVTLSATNTDTWRIYSRIADGSEGATVTVGLSASNRMGCAAYQISGNQNGTSSSEIAISSASNANTANPDPPSLTPSWGSAANIWIAVCFSADSNSNLSSYPTNYSTEQVNGKNGTGAGGGGTGATIAARALTATSEDPGTFAWDSAKQRSAYTLAVRPLVAGNKTLAIDAAGHTFAGTAVTLKHAFKLAIDASAHSFAGTAVTLKHAWKLPIAAAAHTFAATNINLNKGQRFTVDAAAHTFAGTAVTLKRTWKLPIDAAAHTFAGTAVTLRHAWKLSVDAAAHTFSSTSVTLKHGWKVSVDAASHTFAASDISLTKGGTPDTPVIRRFAYDPRDHAQEQYERQKQIDDERRKSIERAWALAHGLPDPYAEEVTPEEAQELPPAIPVDLTAINAALAGAQAEAERQQIEMFIREQEARQADEAMAILLLTA